jgi:hypothetical protein
MTHKMDFVKGVGVICHDHCLQHEKEAQEARAEAYMEEVQDQEFRVGREE